MNTLRLLMAGVMVCVVGVSVRAEEKKDNAKLLVGKWEAVKGAPDALPPGSTVEFLKDGKMKLTMKIEGKDMVVDGTYKVDGDKFMIAMKFGDKEQKKTITIKKISDKELSTEDEEKKGVEFKRVK